MSFLDMKSDETVVTILQEQDRRLIFFLAFISFFLSWRRLIDIVLERIRHSVSIFSTQCFHYLLRRTAETTVVPCPKHKCPVCREENAKRTLELSEAER